MSLTKCDQLPCAAKLVHSLILDPQDPGATKIMERFKQECDFLKVSAIQTLSNILE